MSNPAPLLLGAADEAALLPSPPPLPRSLSDEGKRLLDLALDAPPGPPPPPGGAFDENDW